MVFPATFPLRNACACLFLALLSVLALPALEAMYRFILWLVPAVERFPRSQVESGGGGVESAARSSIRIS